MTIFSTTACAVRTIVANKGYSFQIPVSGFIQQSDRVVFYKLDVLANENRKGDVIFVDTLQIQ